LLPDRPDVVEDTGGLFDGAVGDAAQAAGLLARGARLHGGLALLPPALSLEMSELAGQSVVFPPGAFSFSPVLGFFAPQDGLTAFDGLPAPGHLGPGPGQGFPDACLPVWQRLAKRPCQVVQPGFALVRVPFPPVGVPIPLVGLGVALVGFPFPLVGLGVALVGVPLAPVGPLFLRGTGTAPRVMLRELHPSRMRLSHDGVDAWAGSDLVPWLAFAGITAQPMSSRIPRCRVG
jgi:hypothetical protein